MAYNYLDETAVESDASWHSFGLKTWLSNLTQIGGERWCKASATWGVDFQPTWATPFPVAWGPYYLYAPDNDFRTIDVTIYHNTIVFSPGTEAFRIAVVAEDRLPDVDEWSVIAPNAAAAALTTITCDIVRPGWQRVWIWFESFESGTAADSGARSAYQNPGGLDMTGFGLGWEGAGTLIPYHALRIRQPNPTDFGLGHGHQGQTGGDIGDPYLIGYFDASAARNVAWCAPPVPYQPDAWSDAAWSVHELGKMTVSGISLVAKGAATIPNEESMYVGRPCDWQRHQTPIVAQAKMGKNRIPTYTPWPGFDNTGEWLFHGKDMSSDVDLKTGANWNAFGSAFVKAAIPDTDGYRGIVSLRHLFWPNSDWDTRWLEGRDDITLTLRMMAYNIVTGAVIATGPERDYRIRLDPKAWGAQTSWVPVDAWSPINQTMWANEAWDKWALRGACVGLQDIGDLKHYEIEMPSAGISYPCELTIEAQLGSTVENAFCVAGCGIAAAPRSIATVP